jgi:hypothetical protein
MERFIKLDLKSDSDKPENATLSTQPVTEPDVAAKKLNAIANRAAHKGAIHSSRSGGGIFSK